MSSVIRNFCIQSKPSRGLVFFVVIRTSRSFRFPFLSTNAVVFPSMLIRLSFTSLYSVPIGFNDVILLKCDFGIKITGEPLLSIMTLIGRLLTNAMRVKNSGPFLFGVSNGSFGLLIRLYLVTSHSLRAACLVIFEMVHCFVRSSIFA